MSVQGGNADGSKDTRFPKKGPSSGLGGSGITWESLLLCLGGKLITAL